MSLSARPLLLSLLMLAGCSARPTFTSVNVQSGAIQGVVHGGQQPVVGSSVQLYAAGTTGDGSAATPLLAAPVLTSAGGSFTLTGLYSCPSSSSLVYLVATGGDPGLGTNNPQLALMTAVGPCGSLTPSTFISVNEVTTVAAVYALAPYLTRFDAIGSATSDASALASGFLLSSIFADPASGFSPGPNAPSGYAVPIAQINTIADILSSCINSAGGSFGDTSPCGRLFSLTYPGSGPTPPDTIAALHNLANNPTLNTQSLYALAPPAAPFQPTLTTQPPDFSVHLTPSSSVTLSPLPLSFATTTVGFLESLPVQVTNGGSAAVTLNNFSIAGANPSDFAVDTQSSTCSTSLAPGSSCSMQIDFVPQATGTRTAYLQMNSSVTTQTLPMTGVAVAGTNAGPVTLSPSTVNVPLIGYPSTLTLTNAGSTTLNINRIVLTEGSLSASGSPALTTNFVESNDCGASLPAQSICTITVTEPTGGPYGAVFSASVTVYDDASSGAQTASATFSNCAGCIVQSIGTAGSELTNIGYGGRGNSSSGSLTFGGADPGDFLNGLYTCEPLTGGCNASYTFQPTAPGLRTATFNGPFGPSSLSGYGVSGPFLSITYPSGDLFPYGSFQLGVIQSTQVYVKNSGNNLQLQPPILSGQDAASFKVSTGPNCITLKAGQTCTLSITINPTHVGLNIASLLISDTTNAVRQIIPLVITATPNSPAIGTVAFPNTQPGSTSPVQSVAVSAYNNDPVTATLTSNPTGSIQFSGSNQCAQTPCQLGLTFSPPVYGTTTATLTVKDTVTNLTSTYSFSATSFLVPQLLISPASFAFAPRAVNTTSIAQVFTLTANNAASLPLSSITLGGTNPADFVLTNNCPSTLAGNSSCSLSVSFAPKTAGSKSATITINSGSPTSPDTISLTGTAN